MHDIKLIRDNPQAFDAARARRGLEPVAERLLSLDDARKAAISTLQRAQERRNAASKEIGVALKDKDQAKAEALKAEVAKIKTDWPQLEAAEREAIKALDEALADIRAPVGRGQRRAVRRRIVAVSVLEVVSRQERVLRARPDQASHVVIGEGVGARGVRHLLDFAHQIVDVVALVSSGYVLLVIR